MKIFRKRKTKVEIPHSLLEQNGWGTYQEIPESFESDLWYFKNGNHIKAIKPAMRVKRRLNFALSNVWFRSLVKRFRRGVYELGDGNYSSFD